MSHKSLFKKFFSLFANETSVVKSKNISEAQAINLQQEYIAESCAKNAAFLPPYLEILKQTDSPKDEVFIAALYYLEQIACNESRYKENITQYLEEKTKSRKVAAERKNLILQALERIN